MRVVGSVGRGTERDDSDLDLLVTFEPGVGVLQHATLGSKLPRGRAGTSGHIVERLTTGES
ncbi:MAG: nucleotidyltransferase domain-containing protein [Myxococcales bacterium]